MWLYKRGKRGSYLVLAIAHFCQWNSRKGWLQNLFVSESGVTRFQQLIVEMFIIKFSNDWIWYADLGYWKRPLCLLLDKCLFKNHECSFDKLKLIKDVITADDDDNSWKIQVRLHSHKIMLLRDLPLRCTCILMLAI